MIERRPHWDAELLDAVGRSMHAFYDRPDAMHVYAVIAAVEDWARWEHVPKGTLARLEQAEAAIERVRELHRQSHFSNECIECAPGGTYYWPCPTVEALLDGAS